MTDWKRLSEDDKRSYSCAEAAVAVIGNFLTGPQWEEFNEINKR